MSSHTSRPSAILLASLGCAYILKVATSTASGSFSIFVSIDLEAAVAGQRMRTAASAWAGGPVEESLAQEFKDPRPAFCYRLPSAFSIRRCRRSQARDCADRP